MSTPRKTLTTEERARKRLDKAYREMPPNTRAIVDRPGMRPEFRDALINAWIESQKPTTDEESKARMDRVYGKPKKESQ